MRLQGAFYNFVSSISSGQSATPAPQWRAPQKVKNLTANPSSYYAHITWSRPETDEEVGSSLFNNKDAVLLNNNEPNSVVRYWWRLYECTCGLCDDYNWSCNSIVTTEDVNISVAKFNVTVLTTEFTNDSVKVSVLTTKLPV